MELKIIDSKPLVETVAIVTPTIGKTTLPDNVKSVQNQTYKNIKHYIVTDGEEHEETVHDLVSTKLTWPENIKPYTLNENVGANGWYGHRTYAAFSFLVNADAICFLDEDNWLEPDHVQSLVDAINENGADWAYSFRKIYDKDGNYLCDDSCESLGVVHPVYFDSQTFHIDTSSYLVRNDVATRVASAWYGKWGADRQYFSVLAQHFPNVAATLKHTLCYRLDGNEGSVSREFFEQGNAAMLKRYNGEFPWKQIPSPANAS